MTASVPADSVTRAMPKTPADANLANAESQGMQTGIRVLSYLIAGVACYGGLGWLGDRMLHTSFLLPIGMVLGMAGALYLIIRRHQVLENQPGSNQPGSATDPTEPARRAGKESR